MSVILAIIYMVLQIFWFAILIRAILSWFPISSENPIKLIVEQVTEPILNPIRNALPRTGPVDLSPIAAIMILFVVMTVLRRIM